MTIPVLSLVTPNKYRARQCNNKCIYQNIRYVAAYKGANITAYGMYFVSIVTSKHYKRRKNYIITLSTKVKNLPGYNIIYTY